VNTNLKLCVAYIILISWLKAGLADGYAGILLNFLAILVLSKQLFRKLFWTRKYLLSILPLFLMTTWFAMAYNNPRYRVLTTNDLIHSKMEKTLLESKSSEKIKMISSGINLVIDKAKVNPPLSIALLFHLKNSYIDKYSESISDPILLLLDDYNNNIKLEYIKFLPSITVKSTHYLRNLFFIIVSISLGIIIFHNANSYHIIYKILWAIVINAFLLSLVGIYQRYNQVWTDEYIEILGIWNAPEPRYYFSTFTYKNHWSSFVLLSLSCALTITFKNIKENKFSLTKSPVKIFLMLVILTFLSTIIYSGSRSGLLLSFLTITLVVLVVFIKNSLKKIYNFKKWFLYFAITLPLLFIIFYSFSKDHKVKEMATNSSAQWNALLEGEPPLRFFLWKDAIKMIKQEKILGHGFYAFPTIYPKYQSSHVRSERSIGLNNAHSPYIPLVAHAHNDILEFLAEWGLLGVFIFFIPYLFFLIQTFCFSKSISVQILLTGCLIFIVYCFIDFPTRTPACFTLFCAVTGLACKYSIIRDLKPHRI
jgi:O-antigen ligase